MFSGTRLSLRRVLTLNGFMATLFMLCGCGNISASKNTFGLDSVTATTSVSETPVSFSIIGVYGDDDTNADAYLTSTPNPEISWSSHSGATDYEVEIRNDADTSVVCATQTTTNLNIDLSTCNLVSGTTYRVHVRARVDGALSAAANDGFRFLAFSAPYAYTVSNDMGMAGFELTGESSGFGNAKSIGDINGDGYGDFAIGDLSHNSNTGKVYVVFGKGSDWVNLDASDMTSVGITISGQAANSQFGGHIAGAGDVNGDGYDDILIGAQSHAGGGSFRGVTYLIFGKSSGWSNFTVGASMGAVGIQITGEADNGMFGSSVAKAGDVNGDGYADFIVGAYLLPNGGSSRGTAYIIFGKATGWSDFAVGAAMGTTGIRLSSEPSNGDRFGWAVAGGADFNGDGYADVAISALYSNANGSDSGAVYIIYGKAAGWSDITVGSSMGATGTKLSGEDANDSLGTSLEFVGDVNGDGRDDLLIGSAHDESIGTARGSAYLIFGYTSEGVMPDTTVGLGMGAIGVKFTGSTDDERIAYQYGIAGLGDINADGYDDFIIGAGNHTTAQDEDGQGYVVFGKSSGWADTTLSTTSTNPLGFSIVGKALQYGRTAETVAGVGDINGDGFNDIYVRSATENSKRRGHIIFGFPGIGGSAQPTALGTSSANTLTGTSSADTIVGLAGADQIDAGSAGTDVIHAGIGNDQITFTSTAFRRIDGGIGIDTLVNITQSTLNFTNVAFQRKIRRIEAFDIRGALAQTLTLNPLAVSRMSNSRELVIRRGSNDTVTLNGGTWTNTGTVSIDGVQFDKYTNSNTAVYLESISM